MHQHWLRIPCIIPGALSSLGLDFEEVPPSEVFTDVGAALAIPCRPAGWGVGRRPAGWGVGGRPAGEGVRVVWEDQAGLRVNKTDTLNVDANGTLRLTKVRILYKST